MTISKLRKDIRAAIFNRICEMKETDMQILLTSLTDSIIEWMRADGTMADPESAFDDVMDVLRRFKINPHTVLVEVLDRQSDE